MKTYQNPKTQTLVVESSMTTMQSVSSNVGIKGVNYNSTTPAAV